MGPCWGCVVMSPSPWVRWTLLEGYAGPAIAISVLPWDTLAISHSTGSLFHHLPIPSQCIASGDAGLKLGVSSAPCSLHSFGCCLGTSWAHGDEGLSGRVLGRAESWQSFRML